MEKEKTWLSALPSTCPECLFLVVNWEVASSAGPLSPWQSVAQAGTSFLR